MHCFHPGACPGGGGKVPRPKKLKSKKKVTKANFKLFHLYFATFLVGNIILSAIFELGPLKILKKKNQIFAPPPYEFLDTPLSSIIKKNTLHSPLREGS